MAICENIANQHKKIGSMVAFYIPKEISFKLFKTFQNLPGDAVSPSDYHITLGLVHNPDVRTRKIKAILDAFGQRLKPFSCVIDEIDVFPPNEYNDHKWILHAKPKSDEFKHIHSRLIRAMKKYGVKIDNGTFGFQPHVTIKYCEEKPRFDKIRVKISFTIREISFASRGKVYKVRLG